MSNLNTESGVNNCFYNVLGKCTNPRLTINKSIKVTGSGSRDYTSEINCTYTQDGAQSLCSEYFFECVCIKQNNQKTAQEARVERLEEHLKKSRNRSEWTEERKSLCDEFWDCCAQEEPYCEKGLKLPCELILEAEKERMTKWQSKNIIQINDTNEV